MNDAIDCDEEDSIASYEEGFEALFGGLSFGNISSMILAGEEEGGMNAEERDKEHYANHGLVRNKNVSQHGRIDGNKKVTEECKTNETHVANYDEEHEEYHHQVKVEQQDEMDDILKCNNTSDTVIAITFRTRRMLISSVYQRAFQQSSDGQLLMPSVKIIDSRHDEMKEFAMIATRHFHKGEVIFSERALEGVQMPRGVCTKCKVSSSASDSCHSSTFDKYHQIYKVRGCQNCFKSLEPASSLIERHSKTDFNADVNQHCRKMPLSHLWPIPEYMENGNDEATSFVGSIHDKLKVDYVGRVTCVLCLSTFCNRFCAQNHFEAMGDCCQMVRAIIELIHSIYCEPITRSTENDAGEDESDGYLDIDPVLLLATRMFCVLVNQQRKGKSIDIFDSLCGEAEDVTALGLGIWDPETETYTLEKTYNTIGNLLQLSQYERDTSLSLQLFHKMFAVAQRNAISLMTGSPFQAYYQAILRETGGRGSERQKNASRDIAFALGSHDGVLTRNMDRIIEDKVRVLLVSVPLFNLNSAG